MIQFPDIITVSKRGKKGSGKDIQAAIDQALKSGKHCTVYIPCGQWRLKKPLRLYPPETDFDLTTDLTFSVHLTGARPAYGGQGGTRSFTVLECKFGDAPAIDIQACRGATISNLALEGQNRTLNQRLGLGFVDLHKDDIWLDEGVTEEHAAIAIDRHAGKGSGTILIDSVSARFFGSGISISTSEDKQTQNGENILIQRFTGFYLGKRGVLIGQDQTKGIKLTDCFFHGQQYWIDCVSKGQKKGFPPVISGCIIGATQRLFNLHHAFGSFACHGLFVESTLSLGTIGWSASSQNLPAVFTGCTFDFYQQEAAEAIDTQLVCDRPVLFQGCTFQFNRDDTYKSCFRIHNSQQVIFDTCTFAWKSFNEAPPLAFNLEQWVKFRDCSYQSSWWQYLDGKPSSEQLEIGTVNVQKNAAGIVFFSLPASDLDVKVGDFIGFDKNDGDSFWNAKTHVPDMTDAQKHQSRLPFGVVQNIENNVVFVQQVATTIYEKLDTPQQWRLFRQRTSLN